MARELALALDSEAVKREEGKRERESAYVLRMMDCPVGTKAYDIECHVALKVVLHKQCLQT